MSKIMISSDLHLGHANILKFREGFTSVEEHNEVIFDNLASSVSKRDHLLLLGDVAFTPFWQERVNSIKCLKKTLIMGNHETDRQVPFQQIVDCYDSIHSMWSKKGCWFTHCPIHPQEFRGRRLNIHGHLHTYDVPDNRYVNLCVDKTDFKPRDLQEVLSEAFSRLNLLG